MVIIISTAYSQEAKAGTSAMTIAVTITAIGFNCIRRTIVSFIQLLHGFSSFHMIVVSNQLIDYLLNNADSYWGR
jgi:hypothetical protein